MSQILPQTYAQALIEALASEKIKPTSLTKNFVQLIHKNRDRKKIYQIIKKIEEYYYRQKKIEPIYIYSADKVSQEVSNKILEKVKKYKWTDFTNFEIIHKLDPFIMGGVLVRVRDKLLDISFSEALRQFNEKVEKV